MQTLDMSQATGELSSYAELVRKGPLVVTDQGKPVVRALTRNGWQEVRTKATSHRYFQNPNKGGLVTVPFHRKDYPGLYA